MYMHRKLFFFILFCFLSISVASLLFLKNFITFFQGSRGRDWKMWWFSEGQSSKTICSLEEEGLQLSQEGDSGYDGIVPNDGGGLYFFDYSPSFSSSFSSSSFSLFFVFRFLSQSLLCCSCSSSPTPLPLLQLLPLSLPHPPPPPVFLLFPLVFHSISLSISLLSISHTFPFPH